MLIAGIVCKRSSSPIRGLPDRWIGDVDEGRLVVAKRAERWEMRFLPRERGGPYPLFAMVPSAVTEAGTFREAEALMLEALRPRRSA